MGNIDLIGDPAEIRREAAFVRARRRLAARLRETPVEKLGDSLDMDLIQGMRARFVRVDLLNSDESERGERDGVIDLAARAPFSHSMGRILTPADMHADATAKEDELELCFGEEWSAELVAALDAEERVAVARYAYSRRYRALYKKISHGSAGMLELQERFEALEDRCAATIDRLRS